MSVSKVRATFGFDVSDDVQWEIEVEGTVYFDPGEKASWDYSGGSPEVPPSWEAEVDRLWVIHDGTNDCRVEISKFRGSIIEAILTEATEALIAEECADAEGRRDAAADAKYDEWHDEHR